MTATGFLHPGTMGATIAAACNTESVWVSAGRSPATRARAALAGLSDAESLTELAARTDLIIAVCPPEATEVVAAAVADVGFEGTYVDANAISPNTSRRIGERFESFVDGGIIGPPARTEGTTRLYLSGVDAQRVADRFDGSIVDARVIDGDPGAASALKMAYAAWTKGTTAMLFAISALAAAEGVAQPLRDEWAMSQPDLPERAARSPRVAAPKAWRWVAEMDEIAATFEAAGLPTGFHEASSELYAALTAYKDRDDVTIDQVVATLLDTPGSGS
jgi:3-hydroxyisobutyrate dehydrogenase-like beta-hydroxyacid dehydrogenase